MEAVEAGAGDRGGRACCRVLEADGAVCVRALFEAQQVRLSRADERGEFVRWCADGGVVQTGGRLGESVGHQWAGRGAVDEQGAVDAALHSALIHFVVKCEPGEVVGLLVGVGAVDDGECGGQAEGGQGFEGGDGVGADAFAWRVQDEAERQLRKDPSAGRGRVATVRVAL